MNESEASYRVGIALDVIARMSGYDGSFHKQYCIDQITRALCGGTPVNDYLMTKTEEYIEFVKKWQEGDEGPNTYEWDEGIAP